MQEAGERRGRRGRLLKAIQDVMEKGGSKKEQRHQMFQQFGEGWQAPALKDPAAKKSNKAGKQCQARKNQRKG